MADYRVRVVVTFDLDVGAPDTLEAFNIAIELTRAVFEASFTRADAVDVRTQEIRALRSRPEPAP